MYPWEKRPTELRDIRMNPTVRVQLIIVSVAEETAHGVHYVRDSLVGS